MAQMVVDFAQHDAQFGQVGLLVRFVKVLPQGIGKRTFPLFDGIAQNFERVDAEAQIECRSLGKELPLCGNYVRNSVGRCIGHCVGVLQKV